MCGGSVSFLSPRKWVNEAGNLIENIGETAENILKDPLPTIATIALTAAGVPYPVAAAAVTAAQGGSIEDIAISAGTAYVGQQVGQFAGEMAGEYIGEAVSESTKELITQVVTQASGPAAVVALRGGSFQDILEAGVAGGVSGALSNTLRTEFNMDPKAMDTKLVANATNAATKAVLQGKSISEAVMNAATVTALSSSVETGTNKLFSNNETLKGIREQFDTYKKEASDYFTNVFDPVQTEANEKYAIADELRSEYANVKADYDAKLAEYNNAKANNDATTANALVPDIDALGGKLNTMTAGVNKATEDFNEVFSRLDPVRSTYQDYVNKITSLADTASSIAKEQEDLAANIGVDTVKYQEAVLDERAKLLEDVNRQSLIESQKMLDEKYAADKETAAEKLKQLFETNPQLKALGDQALPMVEKGYEQNQAEREAKLAELTNIGPPEIQAFDDGSFQALYADGTIKVFDDEGALYRTITPEDELYADYEAGIKENTKLFGNIGAGPEAPPVEKPMTGGVGQAISSLLRGSADPSKIAQAALIGSLGAGVISNLMKPGSSELAAQGQQDPIQSLIASRQANVAPDTRRAGSTFFEFVSPVQYAQTTPAAPTAEAPVVQAAEGGLMNIYDPSSSVQMFNAGGIAGSQDVYTALINKGFTPEQAKAYMAQQMGGPSRSRQDREDKRKEREQGLMALAKGGNLSPRYLNGATDGMADKIPAKIGEKQPAALSHGEFVIPADVVSHLGNGNSEAGAKVLYDMMAKIRKARTGNSKQGKQINPAKFMPKG
jgi:hypothetical protein